MILGKARTGEDVHEMDGRTDGRAGGRTDGRTDGLDGWIGRMDRMGGVK